MASALRTLGVPEEQAAEEARLVGTAPELLAQEEQARRRELTRVRLPLTRETVAEPGTAACLPPAGWAALQAVENDPAAMVESWTPKERRAIEIAVGGRRASIHRRMRKSARAVNPDGIEWRLERNRLIVQLYALMRGMTGSQGGMIRGLGFGYWASVLRCTDGVSGVSPTLLSNRWMGRYEPLAGITGPRGGAIGDPRSGDCGLFPALQLAGLIRYHQPPRSAKLPDSMRGAPREDGPGYAFVQVRVLGLSALYGEETAPKGALDCDREQHLAAPLPSDGDLWEAPPRETGPPVAWETA